MCQSAAAIQTTCGAQRSAGNSDIQMDEDAVADSQLHVSKGAKAEEMLLSLKGADQHNWFVTYSLGLILSTVVSSPVGQLLLLLLSHHQASVAPAALQHLLERKPVWAPVLSSPIRHFPCMQGSSLCCQIEETAASSSSFAQQHIALRFLQCMLSVPEVPLTSV